VTLAASGTLDEGVSCSVQTGRAIAQAGLHPATGGDGTLLCSGDMLLEALAASAGVTLRAVTPRHPRCVFADPLRRRRCSNSDTGACAVVNCCFERPTSDSSSGSERRHT
jgi:hypothetical protein